MKSKNIYQKLNDCFEGHQSRLFDLEVESYRVKLKFLFESYMSLSSRVRIGEKGIAAFDREISEIERFEVFILFFNSFSKSLLKNGNKLKLRVFWSEFNFVEKILRVFNDDLSDIDVDSLCEKFSFIKFHPCFKFSKLLDVGFEGLLKFLSNANYKKNERNFFKGLEEGQKKIYQSLIEGLAVHEKLLIVPLDVVVKFEEVDLDALKSDVDLFIRRIKFDKRFGVKLISSFIKIQTRSLFINDASIPVAKLALVFSFKGGRFKYFNFELRNFCLQENFSSCVFEPRVMSHVDALSGFNAFVLSSLNFENLKIWSEEFLFDRNFCSATSRKFFNHF